MHQLVYIIINPYRAGSKEAAIILHKPSYNDHGVLSDIETTQNIVGKSKCCTMPTDITEVCS